MGGLFIPYSEGAAWLKRKYNMDLAENHSQDLTIFAYLMDVLDDHGYDVCNLKIVEGQDPMEFNVLIITQRIHGKFLNVGPPGEEVLQDDLKDILKPGELEKKVNAVLLEALGQ